MKRNEEKIKKAKSDLCGRRDCFSYGNGRCRCLSDTDFGERECPFFKTVAEYEAGLKETEPKPKRGKGTEQEDFLSRNAGAMAEIAAMEAEAERIGREGLPAGSAGPEGDGWEDGGSDGGTE